MSRTLYSSRRIRSPVIIPNSKSFFAQRLGGGIESSCFARPQKIRPVFDCLCERERRKDFFISQKLERLLTWIFRPSILIKQDYRFKKQNCYLKRSRSKKKSINLSHKQNDWLEPFQKWIKDAQSLDKIASDSDLFAKKVCAKEIFGSNLLLGEKTVRPAEGGTPNSFGKMGEISGTRFARPTFWL